MAIVLGYNKPRPTEEDYVGFLETFLTGLEKHTEKGISFMVFGSLTRPEDFIPGVSDVDCFLVTRDDVVTDKELLRDVSDVLADALEKNYVERDFTLSDIATMIDGRFNSFNRAWKPYFQESDNVEVLLGPDYRGTFHFTLPEKDYQDEIVWTLREMRKQYIHSTFYRRNDYEAFLAGFGKMLKLTGRGSKQLVSMVDGHLHVPKFSAVERAAELFPSLNLEPLQYAKWIYTHPQERDKLNDKPEEILKVSTDSLTFFEELIREYMHLVPKE